MGHVRNEHLRKFLALNMSHRVKGHQEVGSVEPRRCALEDLIALNHRFIYVDSIPNRTSTLNEPYAGDASLPKLPSVNDILKERLFPTFFMRVMILKL
jgi:hypothetical protein